jgi:hypothetical protein
LRIKKQETHLTLHDGKVATGLFNKRLSQHFCANNSLKFMDMEFRARDSLSMFITE